MTEERIGVLRLRDEPSDVWWRRVNGLSDGPLIGEIQALGPRTTATIQEIKAEGTRCCGGRAPRPINDEQGVQP